MHAAKTYIARPQCRASSAKNIYEVIGLYQIKRDIVSIQYNFYMRLSLMQRVSDNLLYCVILLTLNILRASHSGVYDSLYFDKYSQKIGKETF